MHTPHPTDLHRAWILAAQEGWLSIQRETPAMRTLRPPVFCIDAEARSRHGAWRTASRRLSLGEHLFTTCHWEDVLRVLRHEIAHQLVAEHYQVHDEPPHGPTFQRACKLLGITPEAKAELKQTPDGDHPIIGRIHKLLALGESPNQHEAETALSKAHALMLKHNLQQLAEPSATTRRYGFRMLPPLHKRVPSYIWDITGILTRYYFVTCIAHPFRAAAEERASRVVEIYGTPQNLDIAESVYHFLLHQATRQWELQRHRHGLRGNRQRLAFLRGLYRGVAERLERERRHLADTQALVWQGDPELQAYFRARNPHIRRGSSRVTYDADAHAAGQAAGRQLRIRRAISRHRGSSESPRRLGE